MDRTHLIDAIRYECRLIRFLGSKVENEHLDYRPTPGQRSLLELLQYLSTTALMPARAMRSGNWDHAKECQDEAATISSTDDFVAHMDRQEAALIRLLEELSDEEYEKEVALPWGDKVPFGAGFVAMPLKFLTAYRMQLFLYLKSAGLSHLSTYELWAGVDAPAPMDVSD